MATRRIQEYLDGHHVRYVMISHSPAYTASEVAGSVHLPGHHMAKVVIVVIDGHLAMAVVPATRDVDMIRLQELTGATDVRLADEAEFSHSFEGCQLGTVPPFGNLFGVRTFVDTSFDEGGYIAFNAGTHTDVIAMEFPDFQRLAQPTMARIEMAPIGSKFHVAQL